MPACSSARSEPIRPGAAAVYACRALGTPRPRRPVRARGDSRPAATQSAGERFVHAGAEDQPVFDDALLKNLRAAVELGQESTVRRR